MTKAKTQGPKTARCFFGSRASALLSLIYILSAGASFIFFSDEIAHSVKSGLSLCAAVIIPSVFPFIIISDLLYYALDFTKLNLLNRIFERIFKISRSGAYAIALGFLCGFPLGVKCTRDLYAARAISKDEAERLIGFSNNTGPAFLVTGIGLGLRGNAYEGIALYCIMIFSAVIVGHLFSIGKKPCEAEPIIRERTFSLTASIKNAGVSTLAICSYLTFFACLCGLLRKLLGETLLYISLLPFIEIGSSASILSKTALLSRAESFALTSFAIGFSGFSVHLQALSFLQDTDIRAARYFIMKLLQGGISLVIAYPLYHLLF